MPNFGETTLPLSQTTGFVAGFVQVAGPFSPLTNGTLQSASIRTSTGGGATAHVKLCLYLNDGGGGAPNTLTDNTAEILINAASTLFTSALSAAILAASGYYIGWFSGDSLQDWTFESSGGSRYFKGGNSYPTVPSPFPASPTHDAIRIGAFATYTGTGSGRTTLPLLGVSCGGQLIPTWLRRRRYWRRVPRLGLVLDPWGLGVPLDVQPVLL